MQCPQKLKKRVKKENVAKKLKMVLDSKKAPENDGDIHFAQFFANKSRRKFLFPKYLFFGFFWWQNE